MERMGRRKGSSRRGFAALAAAACLAILALASAAALGALPPPRQAPSVGSLFPDASAAPLADWAGPAARERVAIGRSRGLAVKEQSGHSYHTAGTVLGVDAVTRDLVISVEESTEDLPFGTRITVRCGAAEHFDVPFEDVGPGDAVQVRSVQKRADDGTIVAQKVFARPAG